MDKKQNHRPPEIKISEADKARILKSRQSRQGIQVDPETLFIAEFGYYYGWGGVDAILNNKITLTDASALLQGAIKVWYGKLAQQGQVQFGANVAAKSGKKGNSVMKKVLKPYENEMKADK